LVTPALCRGPPGGKLHPMLERSPCVYILANRYHGAIYVGVTSNLVGRMMQHRNGTFDGHTRKHGIVRLVYYEAGESMAGAIAREKQLKRWRREWKRNLIERQNPEWNDLAVGLGLGPLGVSHGGAVDPGTGPG
jgi:putative endonuclease